MGDYRRSVDRVSQATGDIVETSVKESHAISIHDVEDPIKHEDTARLRDDLEARKALLDTFTAKESKAIMSKVDRRFFVLIGLMYLIKNLDNNNASVVKVLHVGEPSNILTELGFSTNAWNWVGSIYGIAYILFDLPSNMLLKYFTPHVWQFRIFFLWGIATACSAACQNSTQFLVCRFLVGMFEAGMFPGVVTQLAYWYRTDEYGRPMAWFFSFSTVAGIFGSLICYGVSYMDGVRGLSSWRWVYIIEGVGTVIFSFILYWLLPDFPKSKRSNSWLSPREQEFIEARLPANSPSTNEKSIDKEEIWFVFTSPSFYSLTACQMGMTLTLIAFNWYLPTVITNFGFVGLPANQLLNIPPVAAAILGIAFTTWVTGRAWISRPLCVTLLTIGSMIAHIVLMTAGSAGKYAACILGYAFINSFYPPYWAWRGAYLNGASGAAFAIGFQSAFGNIAAVMSPQFFQAKWKQGGYKQSFGICLGMAVAALIAVLYSWRLTRNVERQVVRVRKEVLKAKREGREYDGIQDIDVAGDETLKNRRLW